MINQVRYPHSTTGGVEVPIAYVDALQTQLDKILSSGDGAGNASQENRECPFVELQRTFS